MVNHSDGNDPEEYTVRRDDRWIYGDGTVFKTTNPGYIALSIHKTACLISRKQRKNRIPSWLQQQNQWPERALMPLKITLELLEVNLLLYRQ